MELIILIIGTIFAVIGYLIKQNIGLVLAQAQDNKLAIVKLNEELRLIETDLSDLHIHIANSYVSKEDFLREIGYSERRLALLLGGINNAEQ